MQHADAAPSGTLYVVATPIGHLGDISLRALEILKTVDCIAAEDTRNTQTLLAHYQIATPLLAYHDHNEAQMAGILIRRLCQGERIALVSDAGTPLIQDPGFVLIRQARAAGISLVPIPGANAAITALSVAGLPVDRFAFEGFPQRTSSKRRAQFAALVQEPRTLIFYESSHRIRDTLADLAAVFGPEREAVVARELTKRFETLLGDTLGAIAQRMDQDAQQLRGELVILVHGAIGEADASVDHERCRRLLLPLLRALPLRQAVDLAVEVTGLRRKQVYQWALELHDAAMAESHRPED